MSGKSSAALPGVITLPLEEQARRVASFARAPWRRGLSFRSANPFGEEIGSTNGVGINNATAIYSVDEPYLIAVYYADWREGAPAPIYGLYEDAERRLVFQYTAPSVSTLLLGRIDISVRDRPPTIDADKFAKRIAQFPLPSPGLTIGIEPAIRDRITRALAESRWPGGDGPLKVRSAVQNEINQAFDEQIAGAKS